MHIMQQLQQSRMSLFGILEKENRLCVEKLLFKLLLSLQMMVKKWNVGTTLHTNLLSKLSNNMETI